MKHRRRNPIKTDLILVLGLAGVAYYLYNKFITPTPGGIVDTITSKIANLFPGTSSSVQVLGTVLMPDGSTFPSSNLTNLNFGFVNGQAQFIFNGATYALTPQVNGVYNAIAL
jgi:hypothetical protein